MEFDVTDAAIQNGRLYPMIRVVTLTKKNWLAYSDQLQSLESLAEYPYGEDFFKINHGRCYFNFFERLGEPLFNVALDGDRVVACAAGILRQLPTQQGFLKAWYLCDLKVHPAYRLQRIPARLFVKKLFFNYLRCPRAYAISMNPQNSLNRVTKIIGQFPYLPIEYVTQLNIYSLCFEEMKSSYQLISEFVGPISYLSLSGLKDFCMKSTGELLNVLHIQHGPLAKGQFKGPQENAVHMICAPQDSPLDRMFRTQLRISPAATASLLAHQMKDIDWSFILTSDI